MGKLGANHKGESCLYTGENDNSNLAKTSLGFIVTSKYTQLTKDNT